MTMPSATSLSRTSLGRRAVVGAAVARDVDDAAPRRRSRTLSKRLAAVGHRRADGRPALRGARRLGELVGEAARGGGAVDHRPVDHRHLVMRAGPFDVAEGDALVLARQDRVDDALVGRAPRCSRGAAARPRPRRSSATRRPPARAAGRPRVAAREPMRAGQAAREPTSAVRRFMSASCGRPASIAPAPGRQTKDAELRAGPKCKTPEDSPASLQATASGLLIVVEATLARLVIALATRRTAFAPPRRGSCRRLSGGSKPPGAGGAPPEKSARRSRIGPPSPARRSAAIATAAAATTVAATAAAATPPPPPPR